MDDYTVTAVKHRRAKSNKFIAGILFIIFAVAGGLLSLNANSLLVWALGLLAASCFFAFFCFATREERLSKEFNQQKKAKIKGLD